MLASCAQLDRSSFLVCTRARTGHPMHAQSKLCTHENSVGEGPDAAVRSGENVIAMKTGYRDKKKRRKWRMCPRPAYFSLTVAAQCQQIRACTTPHETTVTHTRTQATGACNDICVGQLTRYSEAPISVACGTPRLRYNLFFFLLERRSSRAYICLQHYKANRSEKDIIFFSFGLNLALTAALNATFWKK